MQKSPYRKFALAKFALLNEIKKLSNQQLLPCEDTVIHIFYFCCKIQKTIKLVKDILEYVSNMKIQNIEKLL